MAPTAGEILSVNGWPCGAGAAGACTTGISWNGTGFEEKAGCAVWDDGKTTLRSTRTEQTPACSVAGTTTRTSSPCTVDAGIPAPPSKLTCVHGAGRAGAG